MILTLICIGIAVWALYMGLKFYGRMDWDEPAESSPDFGHMHKHQAQLLHVQEVLQEACNQGKLSKGLMEEYNRFASQEMLEIKAAEDAWKNRKKPAKTS